MNSANFFLDNDMNAFELLENTKNKLTSRAYKAYFNSLYIKDITEKQYDNIIRELSFVQNYEKTGISKKEIKAGVVAIKKQVREQVKEDKKKEKHGKKEEKQKNISKNKIKQEKPKAKSTKPKIKQFINESWVPFKFESSIDDIQYNSSYDNIEQEITVDEYNQFYKKRYIFKESTINSFDELYSTIQYVIDKKFRVRRNKKNQRLTRVCVALTFLSDVGNKVRRITITPDYLQSPSSFIERINDILSGRVAGSDAIFFKDNVVPIYNDFTLSGSLFIGGNSIKYFPIFKYTEVQDNKKDYNCGRIVMDKIFKKIYDTPIFKNYASLDFSKLENINNTVNKMNKQFLENDINQNICIIANRVKGIQNKKNQIYTINGLQYTELVNTKPVIINKGNKGKPVTVYIIYDLVSAHFDICFDKLVIRDDLYMCKNGNIMQISEEDGSYKLKKIYSMKQYTNGFYLKNDDRVECLDKNYVKGCYSYCFFDFETIIDFKQNSLGMKVYSCAYYFVDGEVRLEDAVKYEEKDREYYVNNTNTCNFTRVITGMESLNLFCRDILDLQKNRRIIFVGFNNSKFDNILLINEMMTKFNHDLFQLSKEFYRGSALVNVTVNGRHTFFDMRNHLLGSLKSICVSFQVPVKYSKTELDHFQAQRFYDKNQIDEFIKNSNLVEYNTNDVLSLAYIFNKYKNAVYELCSENITDYVTASSLAGALNKKHLKNIGYKRVIDSGEDIDGEKKLPLSYEEYKDMRASSVGGRCQVFNNKKINSTCASLDVCSLYPYVMICMKDVFFPCVYSDKTYTDEYIKYSENCVGFWYCSIDQSGLRKKGYPNFFPQKLTTNNYNHEAVINNVLISNAQIDFMRDIGCDVITHNGFYWSQTIPNHKYFEYLVRFMDEKNKQDTLKNNGSKDYNPAIREFCKVGALNSSFGKSLQTLFSERVKTVKNFAEFFKIQSDAKTESACIIDVLDDGRIIGQFKTHEEELINELKNYSIGTMILEFSRMYMYNYVFMAICKLSGQHALIYTDTDAIKITEKTADRYITWIKKRNICVPLNNYILEKYPEYEGHLIYSENSKIFGSLENELYEINKNASVEDRKKAYMLCLQPKTWIYSVGEKFKFRLKGVNRTDLYLSTNSIVLNNNTTTEMVSIKNDVNINEPKTKKSNEAKKNEKVNEPKTKKSNEAKKNEKKVNEPKTKKSNEAKKNEKIKRLEKKVTNIVKLNPLFQSKDLYYYANINKDKYSIEKNAPAFFEELHKNNCAFVLCTSFKKIVKNTARNVTSIENSDKFKHNHHSVEINVGLKKIKL